MRDLDFMHKLVDAVYFLANPFNTLFNGAVFSAFFAVDSQANSDLSRSHIPLTFRIAQIDEPLLHQIKSLTENMLMSF